MPNANFVFALLIGVAAIPTVPFRASATEPSALLVVTLPIPPDPGCTVHVGIRVPPTKITIPPALLTPLTRSLHTSERVSLWVGGQLAHRAIYFDTAMPLTAAEVNESDTNHGWHPGPTHTIFGCLDRLPETGAPLLFGAPVPVPLGPAYDPSRLLVDATIPHRTVVPRIVH